MVRLKHKEEILKLTQKAKLLGIEGITGQETGTSAAWSKNYYVLCTE